MVASRYSDANASFGVDAGDRRTERQTDNDHLNPSFH